MSGVLEYHKCSVSNGGRIFINIHFADDIVVDAEEEEVDDIVTSIDTTSLATNAALCKSCGKADFYAAFLLIFEKAAE